MQNIPTAQKIEDAIDSLKDFMELAKLAQRDLEEMEKRYRRLSIELTNVQAARMLGVSARTVMRMKEDGRLKSTDFIEVFEYSKQRKP